MRLLSFDLLRCSGIPSVSYLKPEHLFRRRDDLLAADWVLFPPSWLANTLAYAMKRRIFPNLGGYHLGFDKVEKLISRHIIEVAPLAYMRGRTLNNAFVILDEAQNTTPAQMKMFLTRIGFGSRAVVTGDITQTDLPEQKASGLIHSLKILKKIDDIGFTYFSSVDVVRHPLVQSIVEAYDKFENAGKS